MTVHAKVASTPVPAKRVQTRKPGASDREFLPAALEILETPPSPIKMGLLLLICSFFAVALVWSYFGHIDIIAVAQGKLQPTGHVKVIQPLETSRVQATRVENGMRVRAGDVLVELDPSEAAADVAASAASLASYRAEALRREAAIKAAQTMPISTRLDIVWPAETPAAIRRREERVFTADLAQLDAQIASLSAQAQQKRAEHERLATTIVAQEQLIATLQQRVTMRAQLVDMNAGSKSNLIDATETLQYQKTTLAQQKGQLAEAEANLGVVLKDIQKTTDTFIAENAQKAAEAERQAADLQEKLIKAKARLSHMTLTSPIDGTVQASTLTTVGQIVTSGQELMSIVPEGTTLEIEAYLPNKDIGFVKEGEPAIVKIESFPFSRYGTIDARVTRVARDAIPEPDADQLEKDPTRRAARLPNGAQRTQNLVFPVTLALDQTLINVDGTKVPLGAGMAVTVEIRTGSRRILEYVFSPLVQIGSEAMKER
ncbi:hemolysin D [Rhizobiales bacterium GAS113]|nr:hemolysin D [Rhizobiales bacterium GAS113]SDR60417.1 hemolysin D [Rhizobiales bacterium GAS113]